VRENRVKDPLEKAAARVVGTDDPDRGDGYRSRGIDAELRR
jgi:hypothetical protein